jgi:hypothetical protein
MDLGTILKNVAGGMYAKPEQVRSPACSRCTLQTSFLRFHPTTPQPPLKSSLCQACLLTRRLAGGG